MFRDRAAARSPRGVGGFLAQRVGTGCSPARTRRQKSQTRIGVESDKPCFVYGKRAIGTNLQPDACCFWTPLGCEHKIPFHQQL